MSSSNEEGGLPATQNHHRRIESCRTIRTETTNPALLALLRENSAAGANENNSSTSSHTPVSGSPSHSFPRPDDTRERSLQVSHHHRSSSRIAHKATPKPTGALTDRSETDATASNPFLDHSSPSLGNPNPLALQLASPEGGGALSVDPSTRSVSQTIIQEDQAGHRNSGKSATPIKSNFLPRDTDSARSELTQLLGTPSRKSFVIDQSPICKAETSEEGTEGYYGDEDNRATGIVTSGSSNWLLEEEGVLADQSADAQTLGHKHPPVSSAAAGSTAGEGSAGLTFLRALPSPDLAHPQHHRFVTPYGSRRLKDKPLEHSSAVQTAPQADTGASDSGIKPPLKVPKDQAWSAKQVAKLRQGNTSTEEPWGSSHRVEESRTIPNSLESPGSATPRDEESSPAPVDSLDIAASVVGQKKPVTVGQAGNPDRQEEEEELLRGYSSSPIPVEEGTSDLPPTIKPTLKVSGEQASTERSVTVPAQGVPQAEHHAAAPSILKKPREVEGDQQVSKPSSEGGRDTSSMQRVYVDSPTFTRDEEEEYRFVSSRVDNHDDDDHSPAHPTYRGMDQQAVNRMENGSANVASRTNSRPFKQVRYQDEGNEEGDDDDRYDSRYEDRDELLQNASHPPRPTNNPPAKQFVLKTKQRASADQAPPSVGARSLVLPSGPTFDPADEVELEKEKKYQHALKDRLDILAEHSLEVPRLNLLTESEEFARDSLDIPEDVALDSDRDPRPNPHHHPYYHPQQQHYHQYPDPQPRDSLDIHKERRLQQAMRDTHWENPPTPPYGPPPAPYQVGRVPLQRQGYWDPEGYGDPQRQGERDLQGYRDPHEYMNPQRKEYRDPEGYMDPDGYRDPQRQGYRDPQLHMVLERQGYRDPEGYMDPQGYGDPQKQGYSNPQRQGFGGDQRQGYRDPQRPPDPQRQMHGSAPDLSYRQGYEEPDSQGYAESYRQGPNSQGWEGYAPLQRQNNTDSQGSGGGFVDIQRETFKRPGQRKAQPPYRGDPQVLGYGDFQQDSKGHWKGYGGPSQRNPFAGNNDVTQHGAGGDTVRRQQYGQPQPPPPQQQGGYYAQETEPPRLPQAARTNNPLHQPPQEPRGLPPQEQYMDLSDFGHQSAQPARNTGGVGDTDRYKAENASSQRSTAREGSILLAKPVHDYIAQNKMSYGLPKKNSYRNLHAQKKEEEEKLNHVFIQPKVKDSKGQRSSNNNTPSRYPTIAENPNGEREGEEGQGAEELWAHRSASLARTKNGNGKKGRGGSNTSMPSLNNSRLPAMGTSAANRNTSQHPPNEVVVSQAALVPFPQQVNSTLKQQQLSSLHYQPQVTVLPSVTRQIVGDDGQRISVDVNLRLISPPVGTVEMEGGSTQSVGKQRLTGMQYPSEHAGMGRQQPYDPSDLAGYPSGGRYSADDILSSKALEGLRGMEGYHKGDNYRGTPGSYSTNPYKKIPPIPTSSEAPRSAPVQSQTEGGSYMQTYLREKEKIQQQGRPSYHVYSLRDYQRMQKEVRLGTLGPDMDSDIYRERREKMQRQQDYAKSVKDKNTREMVTRKPPTMPRLKESDDILNRRKLAMEYAKNVPKPTVKPQPSPYNNYEMASKLSPSGQHQPLPSTSDDLPPSQGTSVDILELEKLHERHQQDKRNVEAIRQKGILS